MKLRKLMLGCTALAVALALGSAAIAQAPEKKDDKKPAPATGAQPTYKPADKTAAPAATPKPGDKPAAGQPSAEEAAMMAKMMEYGTPGEAHKKLNALVGSWTCESKMFKAPGAPAEVGTGTAERKWVLDGRYLFEEVKSTMMGMPFSGIGYAGYDNHDKKYFYTWIDSMGTGMWRETGTADAAGKVFNYSGENYDCMSDKVKKTRSTMEIVDNSKQVMKMYDTGPDGKEFVAFELNCTRK
jgi:hypothetical protein